MGSRSTARTISRRLLPFVLTLALGSAALGETAAPGVDLYGGEEQSYFYHGLDYGSERLVHPLRLILNGGYGILQLDNRDNDPRNVDYRTGLRNVWKNISHPFSSIENDGWSEFIQREIIPLSLHSGNAQYWPNYTQHLIGGGMSYRMMLEWFRWHGWPHPNGMALSTITVYHFLNEVVENNDFEGWRSDPVADLWVFDPLSILLFSSERVSRFFGETLHMRDWSYQISYNPSSGTIENNGQNFALKWYFKKSHHWGLFYHWGTRAELGLTRRFDDDSSISAGAGFVAGNIIDLEGSFQTVDLANSAGIFYDRHHSLLASITAASAKDYKMRLNLYPGLIHVGPVSPGFFGVWHRDDDVTVGITLDFVPALPVGLAGQL